MSPALAQTPAPTPELQGKPIQSSQGGKLVEFRQPRPVAFDKASAGNSDLAKLVNEGVGQESPVNVEEQVLLPLLLEEKRLLENYGSEHSKVRSIRERIRIVREYLAQHPPAASPTTRRQDGKSAELRQPRPVAFDTAILDNSVPAKPGNEGVGQEAPGNVEEQALLPLLLKEKSLLVNYGPDHSEVRSIRERIRGVREYLAQHPPAPPPTCFVPLPPISTQTPYRETPSTTASTSSSPGQTPLLPSRGAKDRYGNTQTATSRNKPERIRSVGFSTAGNLILDPDTAPASLAAPPPPVVEINHKDTHPAVATTNSSAQAGVSPPRSVGNSPASQPSQEQPRGNSFFETGFGQLIGIVGAMFLGVLIHLIALVFILRHFGANLARVFRVELVNPAAVGLVGQVAAGGAQSVAADSATKEATQSSVAETFDIGPTYAEEMRQKQEAERQQEEAVLRHIFVLNMEMREQLGQLSGGAD